MKKNRIFILISALFLSISFISCGVDPNTIELLSKEEIVAKMNNTFEGDFTYKSEVRNGKDKSVTVTMECTIGNNSPFDVKFSEKHKRNLGEFGAHYYDDDECYTTNYYSKRYESELMTNLESEIKTWLEETITITTTSSDAFVQMNQTFSSFTSFLDYYKKNCIAYYRIVVSFAKGSNSNFDVCRKSMNYQHDTGKDFQWVSGKIIYDPDNKYPDKSLESEPIIQ